jgi:ketosteroid isomerase-like protein
LSASEQNLALGRELLAAFQRGDIAFVLERFDPEIEVFSTPELPNPGRFRGREGYLQWIGQWLEAWEVFEVEAKDFEAVGERHVVMPSHQRGVGKGSGVEVEMDACYMIEVENGLVTRFHFYGTREQALQAARAGEERAATESRPD